MNESTVYKLVRPQGEQLLSSWVLLPNFLVIEYEVGSFVTSPYGPLFAFDNGIAALRYLYSGLELWEAVGTNVRPLGNCSIPDMSQLPDHRSTAQLVQRYWNGEYVGVVGRILAPSNSVLCDAIKLVRRY